MALGTMTWNEHGGEAPSKPRFIDRLSFAGDSAYPTGGTAAFEDSYQAKIGQRRKVLSVKSEDCGAYGVVYDRANDKLKVIVLATGVEVANATDLSATTFVVVVESK